MDDHHFDRLTRAVVSADTRRNLIRGLVTLPGMGGVFGVLSSDDAEGQGRRKRRKKAHKHGKGRTRSKRKSKKKCKPESAATTCAGKCGSITNTCKQAVDCGSCDCSPTCETCFTCQGAAGSPGSCVPQETGVSCGDPTICESGTLIPQGSCDGSGTCEPGTPVSCAPTGNNCTNLECQCGSGATCSGDAPTCCGSPGSCTNTDTDADNCGACGNACSGATPTCVNGACACGDVCASGCQFSTVQAAIDALPAGSTIRLCAGTYAPTTIGKNLTLKGVGDGSNPASNTILDGGGTSRVIAVGSGVTVTLQGLRITRGRVEGSGGGIRNQGNLTLTGCTITDNQAVQRPNGSASPSGGGIDNSPTATLTMTNCTISNNSALIEGGGVELLQGTHTLTNCTFSGNTAGYRGAAVMMNNGGATTVTGCTIGPGNNSPDAAVVVWSSSLALDATSVSGNTGTYVGGISNSGGVVILQNGSTVSGNMPNNCSGTITGTGCAA